MASDPNRVITIGKRSNSHSSDAITAARRQGVAIQAHAKPGAGANKQRLPLKFSSNETNEYDEQFKHKQISASLAEIIRTGRLAKELTQKDLAGKICEKVQIIKDYESGRGIPNNAILAKLERVIGMKLRGKELGQPLAIKK